jgi:hypothetical protein
LRGGDAYNKVPIQGLLLRKRVGNIGSCGQFSLDIIYSFIAKRTQNTADITSREIEILELQAKSVPAWSSTATRGILATRRKKAPARSNLTREARVNGFCIHMGTLEVL